jgi:hypothetical protein
MGIRRIIQRVDGAAKAKEGQVQRGNTCRELSDLSEARAFHG